MVAGQVLFAVATDVRLALAARVLLGIGDAMTFISVLRLVALWLPARRNALYVQLLLRDHAVQVWRYRNAARRDLALHHPDRLADLRRGVPVVAH
jgi:hypothetical protein